MQENKVEAITQQEDVIVSDDEKIISNLLTIHFYDGFYSVGGSRIRSDLSTGSLPQEDWALIKNLISTRAFSEEDVLDLIWNSANTVLDENTADEAYGWLDLLVKNVDNIKDPIIEY